MNISLDYVKFFKNKNIFQTTIFHIIVAENKTKVILSIEKNNGDVINITPLNKNFKCLDEAVKFIFDLFLISNRTLFTFHDFDTKVQYVESFTASLPKAEIYSFSHDTLKKMVISYKKIKNKKSLVKWVPSVSALYGPNNRVSLTISLHNCSNLKSAIIN